MVDMGDWTKIGEDLGRSFAVPLKKRKSKRDSRRGFTTTQKNQILYQQNNKCARCYNKLDPRAIEFDHKKPWASGGRTVIVNGRALCPKCHKIITHKARLMKVDEKRKKRQNQQSIFDVKIPEVKIPKIKTPFG